MQYFQGLYLERNYFYLDNRYLIHTAGAKCRVSMYLNLQLPIHSAFPLTESLTESTVLIQTWRECHALCSFLVTFSSSVLATVRFIVSDCFNVSLLIGCTFQATWWSITLKSQMIWCAWTWRRCSGRSPCAADLFLTSPFPSARTWRNWSLPPTRHCT